MNSVQVLEAKKIVVIRIKLTKSFEIPRINLELDYNNFILSKIIYSLSKVKKISFTLLNLITIIDK